MQAYIGRFKETAKGGTVEGINLSHTTSPRLFFIEEGVEQARVGKAL